MQIVPNIDDRDPIVAIHEAAHAVACVKLGVPFSSVSIDLSGAGPGAGLASEVHAFPGGQSTEGDDETNNGLVLAAYAQRCRKQVIVCFAGRAAEERAAQLGLTCGVGVDSDLKDRRDARYFLRQLLGAEDCDLESRPALMVSEMARLKNEAESLVISHFAAIETIAQTLMTKKTMSRDQVAELVGAT